MATSVATVPAVKRAVHHATQPRAKAHAPKPRPRLTQAALPVRSVPCAPITGGNGVVSAPVVPLVSFAAPIPDEPPSSVGNATNPGDGFIPAGFTPIGGLPSGGGGGVIAPPITTPTGPDVPAPTPTPAPTATPTEPVIVAPSPVPTSTPGTPPVVTPPVIIPGPVPEPSVWAMLIVGFGLLGAGLRRRRRPDSASKPRRTWSQLLGAGAFWSGAAPLAAGDAAAGVATKSAATAVAGKVMLCVCPAALVAGTVMTVPPVRNAVHGMTATAPVRALPIAPVCDDTVVPAAVPVAAAAPAAPEQPAG